LLLGLAQLAQAQVGPAAPLGPDLLPGGTIPIPFIELSMSEAASGSEVALSIQLMLLLAVLTLAPSFAVLLTSFLRISIVFDFVKRAMSLQQSPPPQVLNGVALFLTIFIMWPTFSDIYNNAIQPLSNGEISVAQMYTEAERPIRLFMFRQMSDNPENIRLFMRMRGLEDPHTLADVPTHVLIPAFILNELTIAFKIGVYIFVPFIIIDMVVASCLMAMGMIMLPPVMISMPFKLILFWLLDGWNLLARQIFLSFNI